MWTKNLANAALHAIQVFKEPLTSSAAATKKGWCVMPSAFSITTKQMVLFAIDKHDKDGTAPTKPVEACVKILRLANATHLCISHVSNITT